MENTTTITKEQALANFLEIDVEEVTEQPYGEFSADGADYMVLTDDEADEAWEESLDSYLEECIYPELPDYLVNYFDEEAWKRDARYDGRGHSLNHYDGSEEEQDGYLIYRTN